MWDEVVVLPIQSLDQKLRVKVIPDGFRVCSFIKNADVSAILAPLKRPRPQILLSLFGSGRKNIRVQGIICTLR